MSYFLIRESQSEKGQVLLIVVLTMVVALTVGLSLAARTVTNLRNTAEDTGSQQAFSAAEAGIERGLKSGLEITDEQLDSQTTIKQVTIDTNYGRSAFPVNNGNPLSQDDGVDIWLSTFPDYSAPQFGPPPNGSKLQVYWGDSSSGCSNAALEIIVISGTTVSPKLERYALDPCGTRGNNFDSPSGNGGTILGHVFHESVAVTVVNGLIARIVPYYQGTSLAVVGTDTSGNVIMLPTQGRLLTSVGASKGTQRKISYFEGYDELPSELFYSIFQLP
jgi:hypothetical protein